MATRAHKIAQHIDTWAKQHPQGALTGTLVGSALVLLCTVMAVLALFSGPIGVDILDRFPGTTLSRLAVLQGAASLGVLSFAALAVFVVNWGEAPKVLKVLYLSRWAERIAHRLARGFSEGSTAAFWGAIGLVAVWVNVEMLVRLPIVACLEPDTVGYLQPSAIRSSGYMFFLDAIVTLTGDMKWIYPVQLNLMLLSFATLGLSVRRVVGSFGAGLIVALIPMVSSGLLILAPAVMSEALFAALICFHLAGVLWALRSPSWIVLLGVGLTLGLMIVVRPNGISFMVTGLMLMWMLRHVWRRVVLALALPLIVIIGAQGLYHHYNYAFFGLHKFGAISLSGNFAPLIRADMGSANPELAAQLEQKLAHYSRDFPPFSERGYPFEMAKVAELTTVGAIYRIILPSVRTHLDLAEPKAVAFEYDPRISQITGDLAKSAVLNDPLGAVQIVSSNFISAWNKSLPIRVPMAQYFSRCATMNTDVYAQHAELISGAGGGGTLIEADTLLALSTTGQEGLRLIEWPRLVLGAFQKGLAYLALMVSIWFCWQILRFRGWGQGDVLAGAVLSISVLAGYGLISLGNTAFTRYTVVFDPVLIALLVVFAVNSFKSLYLLNKNNSAC
ncbi:hypothetical protein V5T82_08650 [Magnetovibrio sp. PR-2]|uniref:hypothetical protein n=1 Tax=Magnetovibrio sp. PR-2 TaxID=3120356 RepID=UPI002FCE12D0